MSSTISITILLKLISLLVVPINSYRNNVCSNYISYFYADFSSNCYYIRDVNLNMPDRLVYRTHRSETHTLRTTDGHILPLHRLRHPHPKGIILLQHPLTTDSRIWMAQGADSLALHFFHNGYDVWMPNFRGTRYAQRHLTYTPRNTEFWNFDYYKLGYYDVSASINYIYRRVGRKVIYIGHSLSTSAALVYGALRPMEAVEKVDVMVLLGTVAYMRFMESPTKYTSIFEPYLNFLPMKGVLRPNSLLIRLFSQLVAWLPFKFILPIGSSFLGGWNPSEYDPKYASIMTTVSSGSSMKLFQQFGQILRTKEKNFNMYDYGRKKNLLLYNQTTPPEFPVGRIKTPIFMISGPNDSLANFKDLDILMGKLSPEAKKYGEIRLNYSFNHFDFQIGKHRMELVWNPIVKFLIENFK